MVRLKTRETYLLRLMEKELYDEVYKKAKKGAFEVTFNYHPKEVEVYGGPEALWSWLMDEELAPCSNISEYSICFDIDNDGELVCSDVQVGTSGEVDLSYYEDKYEDFINPILEEVRKYVKEDKGVDFDTEEIELSICKSEGKPTPSLSFTCESKKHDHRFSETDVTDHNKLKKRLDSMIISSLESALYEQISEYEFKIDFGRYQTSARCSLKSEFKCDSTVNVVHVSLGD